MAGLSKGERLKLYLPLLAQGLGWRRIAKSTGLNPNTVKSDLRELRRGTIPHQPVMVNHSQNTPSHTPLDWNVQADRIGNLILSLIDDAVKTGREDTALKWTDRFFRGMQSRLGILKLTQYNQTLDIKQVILQELPSEDQEYLLRQASQLILKDYHEKGNEGCALCGQMLKKER